MPQLPQLDASELQTSTEGALTVTGSTYAIEEATLGPKASGTLAKVYVEQGDRVKKGQVLFVLDASAANLGVRQAETGVAAAKVALSRAQLEYDRTKQLFDRSAVAPALYDQARLALDQAKVGVSQAEVALSTARKMAADAVVTSPISGIVTAKLKNTGETVTMMPPTSIIVVQNLSTIEVRVRLAERALKRVKTDDPMKVHFPSIGKTPEVKVSRIDPSIDPRLRTIEVIGRIPNEEGELKSGMLAEVTFPNASSSGDENAEPEADAKAPPATETNTR
jgi:RND family efflux transporter MFP subunit